MENTNLTNRQQEILQLIKEGMCLPREIAHQLKANKTNVSTALKALLDQGYVVRTKFYGTYVYAVNQKALLEQLVQKERVYSKQMKMEKEIFSRRKTITQKYGYL